MLNIKKKKYNRELLITERIQWSDPELITTLLLNRGKDSNQQDPSMSLAIPLSRKDIKRIMKKFKELLRRKDIT